MSRGSRFRPWCSALLIAAIGGAAAPASAAGIWGGGKSSLVMGEDGYRLRFGGSEFAVRLPERVVVESVVALADRALVLGFVGNPPQLGVRGELFVAFADGSGVHELAPPPGRLRGAERESPVALLGSRGELAGLAWLEGETQQRNAVRAASFDGARFGEPHEIAPAGPGSQVALAGARLDDGSSLLVWARYDGHDDEVVWSRSTAGDWSEPRPIAADNPTPDIVPAVAALPRGAVSAWTRYDGHDYRVVVSTLSDGAWSEPATIGGRGSVFPTLERTAEGARLLFESAGPHGWTVVELDAGGRAIRSATVATADPHRPIVDGDRLRWAGADRALTWHPAAAAPPN